MVGCTSVSVCESLVGFALGFPKSVELVHQWLTPLDVTEPNLQASSLKIKHRRNRRFTLGQLVFFL
jgi:hypothetical protein